jgi:Flp pilus assembly protein TadG
VAERQIDVRAARWRTCESMRRWTFYLEGRLGAEDKMNDLFAWPLRQARGVRQALRRAATEVSHGESRTWSRRAGACRSAFCVRLLGREALLTRSGTSGLTDGYSTARLETLEQEDEPCRSTAAVQDDLKYTSRPKKNYGPGTDNTTDTIGYLNRTRHDRRN